MDSINLHAELDDREEGEIVDDDFEDISDNSIIVPIYSGKSVSPKEHLPAISLSSVTDVDEPKGENRIRHRHKTTRKKSTKSYKKRRNNHRKSACSDSDSSDDLVELDRQLQRQLQAAVRVDKAEERHQNSLRSRLKGMTKLDESDGSAEKNDNGDKIEQRDTSDEGDSELAQLRMEALRTAVLNKFMHRKKRKVKESIENDVMSDVSVKTDNSETNKENSHILIENCPKKICVENPVQSIEKKIEITSNIVIENTTAAEDDEDVLRALLLASMSKKITRESGTKKVVVNNGIKHTLQAANQNKELIKATVNNTVTFKNRVSKKNVLTKDIQLPKVKPLIINVNEDSDSEDDFANSRSLKSTDNQMIKSDKKDIENTVDQFLKEQRAKVEAQLSPIPKNPVFTLKSPEILEKSSVKLLPKVKQVEYQRLLQTLKNAEKKRRLRRLSHKANGEVKTVMCTSTKIVTNKLPGNREVSFAPKVEPLVDKKTDIRTLHMILKEIQVQKDGRLQMQEKYLALMPLIKIINEASIERRKQEEDIKRLLQEIAEKKKQLVSSQQDFSVLVKNLMLEKEKIDKSTKQGKPEPPVIAKTARFTSTPIRDKPPVVSFETNSPNTTILLPENTDKVVVEKQKEEASTDTVLQSGDPNDIDKIYSKQKPSILKYISPLDNVKREVTDDPFSIVCPYDVDGNCRDPQCSYKHLSK